MLWTCLLLPSLPLDVFARAQASGDAGRPFAVTSGGHHPRVVAANAAARAAGIRDGSFVSAALALAPDLVLRERDPRAEEEAIRALAAWATQFTPAVSLAPPDAVLAEIGGSLRLFGGLERLAAHLERGAHDLGFELRLAFAPTATAALFFARSGESGIEQRRERGAGKRPGAAASQPARASTRVVADAAFVARLAPLPLAHLDVARDVLAMLAAAGIRTFGEACAQPREALARRAGPDFVATLDRARGWLADPRPPFVPPPRYEGRLELPVAVEDVEALAFALNRLVHELAGWLEGRGLGVVALELALAHERHVAIRSGTAATHVRFALNGPARAPAHLVAVLRERLARVTLPAPVVALALASDETAPLAGRNLGLLPGEAAPATVPLLDRLRARLGEDALTLVRPHAEHRPEKSSVGHYFRHDTVAKSCTPAEVVSDTAFPPRPLWLLAEPEPLGERLEIEPWVLKDGPERIESGWWDGADVRRDYFVAANPRGETVWIYRDHRYGTDDGEWFLHGLFA